MPQSNKYTIPEMQAQIAQLTATMNLPGVPADEIAIYRQTIARIQGEINARNQTGPVTPAPTPTPPTPIKTTTPPIPNPQSQIPNPPMPWPQSSHGIEAAIERDEARTNQHPEAQAQQQPETQNPKPETSRHIHAGNQTPVNSKQPMSATIQADHSTNPHNPTVTITWADGYTYTGDETAIRGRFTTTFRDTIGLRLVQAGRYSAMWRWSSPWRAAGFYQALTHLIGAPPTLQELGVQRPSEITRTVFNLITERATVATL